MEKLPEILLPAVTENLFPIVVSLALAGSALGYRRALKRLRQIVKDTENTFDDRVFEAFENELRKRGLLPEGYENAIVEAKEEARKQTSPVIKALGRAASARLFDKVERR